MIPSQNFPTSFLYKKELAENTFSFFFKRPAGFEFIAGQFNRWTLPIEAIDGRGAFRFFTISSSPLDTESISFTTRIIQSDYKKALLDLKENDEIKIFGPNGKFILDVADMREKILIAGGIGITPFHSILTYAAAKSLDIPLLLFASFSTPEEMIFYDDLTSLPKEHQNIRTVFTITKPEESQKKWDGPTGRISTEMIQKYSQDINKSVFYVVGPPAMVEGTKKMLGEAKIPEENIKTELFTGY